MSSSTAHRKEVMLKGTIGIRCSNLGGRTLITWQQQCCEDDSHRQQRARKIEVEEDEKLFKKERAKRENSVQDAWTRHLLPEVSVAVPKLDFYPFQAASNHRCSRSHLKRMYQSDIDGWAI
jgi:hypothetical protein